MDNADEREAWEALGRVTASHAAADRHARDAKIINALIEETRPSLVTRLLARFSGLMR